MAGEVWRNPGEWFLVSVDPMVLRGRAGLCDSAQRVLQLRSSQPLLCQCFALCRSRPPPYSAPFRVGMWQTNIADGDERP